MAPNDVSATNGGCGDVLWPRRRSHVEERDAGSDLVLYDPVGGRLHVLNTSAAAVWRLCDGSLQAAALATQFSAGFDVRRDQNPIEDVKDLLRSFLEAGLIEDGAGPSMGANGAAPVQDQQE